MQTEQRHFERYIEVKFSLIHGRGLFAGCDINEGEVVMPINGEIISGDECERREDENNNVYIFWKDDDTYIDTVNSEKIKFINHNCDPNCEVDEDNEGALMLYAIKDIKAGDEITIDYDYEEIYEDCSCNECDNKKLVTLNN